MDRFWDLFQESVILQGLLTVSLWGAIITLTLQGREVPGVCLAGDLNALRLPGHRVHGVRLVAADAKPDVVANLPVHVAVQRESNTRVRSDVAGQLRALHGRRAHVIGRSAVHVDHTTVSVDPPIGVVDTGGEQNRCLASAGDGARLGTDLKGAPEVHEDAAL